MTVTADDGTATADTTLSITVEDDSPIVTESTNLVFSNTALSGIGAIQYSVGADQQLSYGTLNSNLASLTMTGTVASIAVTAATISNTAATATSSSWDVSFNYVTRSGADTRSADGSLSIDQSTGTYTFTLDSALDLSVPLDAASGNAITSYDETGSVVANKGVAAVAAWNTNFYVQYNAGSEHKQSDGWNTTSSGDQTLTNGETMVTYQSEEINVSNGYTVGVGNNFVTGTQILDLNFYSSDPAGDLTLPADASLDAFYMVVKGYADDDAIILLKLKNASGDETTKTLIIGNEDFISDPANALALDYGLGAQLDGTGAAAIVIESNDYNSDGETWTIYGVQFSPSSGQLSSTSAIDFDGTSGSSVDTTTSFNNETADIANNGRATDEQIEIVNIGGTQSAVSESAVAELQFNFVVDDADGDTTSTETFTIVIDPAQKLVGTDEADIIRGTTSANTITGGAGADKIYLGELDGAVDTVILDNIASSDLIYDFEVGTDQIDLSALISGSESVSIDTVSGNSTIEVDGSIVATIMGVEAGLSYDTDTQIVS